MFSTALLAKLLLSIFLVGFTPGPANIYALSCGLQYGRRHAMGMWTGLLCGFSIVVTAAALISHLAGTAMGEYVQYIRYPGAAYIAWLAWGMLRNDSKDNDSCKCSFTDGLMVQLTNAKMIVFTLTTFGTFVLPLPGHTFFDYALVWALLFIAGPGANLVWLLLGLKLRPYFTEYHRTPSVIMAIALLACAIFILL